MLRSGGDNVLRLQKGTCTGRLITMASGRASTCKLVMQSLNYTQCGTSSQRCSYVDALYIFTLHCICNATIQRCLSKKTARWLVSLQRIASEFDLDMSNHISTINERTVKSHLLIESILTCRTTASLRVYTTTINCTFIGFYLGSLLFYSSYSRLDCIAERLYKPHYLPVITADTTHE